MDKRIMVIAPHPNDETLGCGGTIAKKITEGYEVIIVIITDGRNLLKYLLGIESDPSPEEVKKIRREEVIRATNILGVPSKNLLFLEFEDGTLKDHGEKVEEKIIQIIEEYYPVELYYPHKNDVHPDHQETNQIVKRLLRKLGLYPVQYQYPGKHKYGRIGPLMEKGLDLFRRTKFEVDISEFLDLKKKALNEFKSETSIISKKQKKPLDNKLDKYQKKHEMFYIHK